MGQSRDRADLWKIIPKNMKGRSLGERPAFLRSPPGCGISKPWGVWEGGFDERLGGPPAGYVDLSGVGRAWVWRCQSREKPFRYELQVGTTVSNEGNLTNELGLRYLQKCISGPEAKCDFPGFCCISVTADRRKRVGWNPSKKDQFDDSLLSDNHLEKPGLLLHGSRDCKFADETKIGANPPCNRRHQQA